MPVQKEDIINSFNMFPTEDSYRQNVSLLTDKDIAMVPVAFQELELRVKELENKVTTLKQSILSLGGNV